MENGAGDLVLAKFPVSEQGFRMKYERPDFLKSHKPSCGQEAYERWLRRRANAHVKRDRKRKKGKITPKLYREAIHEAVKACGGRDCYTGEALEWGRISKYDNTKAKKGKHGYKKEFALLPTVDHDHHDDTQFHFRICSWRTNDSKNDLTLEEFKELCRKILRK